MNDKILQDIYLNGIIIDNIKNKKKEINLDKHYSLKEMKNRLNKSLFNKLKYCYDYIFIKDFEEYFRELISNGINSIIVQSYKFNNETLLILNNPPTYYKSNSDKKWIVLSFIDEYCNILIKSLCYFYDLNCENFNNDKKLYINSKYQYKNHFLPKFGDCF